MTRKVVLILLLVLLVIAGAAAFISPTIAKRIAYARMPAPVDRTVTWAGDVKPILDQNCAKCHAGKAKKGGFQYDTEERFKAGVRSHPVAIAGDSRESMIVKAVVGFPGLPAMPRGQGTPLTAEDVGVLRAWIDQGMKFDE